MTTKPQKLPKNHLKGIKKPLTFLLCLFFVGVGYGQNIVGNPSFEDTVSCPNEAGEINKAIYWGKPTLGTPDYFNSCSNSVISDINVPLNIAGFQNPKTGEAYAGFAAMFSSVGEEENREYLETKLMSPLLSGQRYYVSFFVSLADSSNWATDDIGLFFSVDSIYGSDWNNLEYVPQIENQSNSFITEKENWTQISGEFIAQGGEEYITIGNFKDSSNTTTQSVTGGIYINCAYYYIDDICVSSNPSTCPSNVGLHENQTKKITISPNPTTNYFKVKLNNISDIKIFNSNGVLIYDKTNFNEIDVDCLDWEQGIYFIEIKNDYQYFTEKLIIIHP